MAMEYFCCYHSYLKKTQRLSDQEVGRLFRALITYSASGEAPELTGRESMAFDFIADDIDRAKQAYEERCATNAANASGRKRTQTNASESSQNEDEDKNKDKDKDKDNSPPDGGEGARARGRGIPTLDDVRAFCRERNSCVNPDRFYSYWQERDWQGVNDWQERIVGWETNGIDRPDAHTTPPSYDIGRAEKRAKTTVPTLTKKERR